MQRSNHQAGHDLQAEVAIVGGGAAGLATAIFCKRLAPDLDVAILDGAKKLGAKILISGGGRCNVTNTVVRPEDFQGGSRNTIRRILSAFTAADAAAFFRELGVGLHEEPGGKLFPDSNSARTVLAALLEEAERLGVQILTETRVEALVHSGERFSLATQKSSVGAAKVVLATGGLSLPKTGSDGGGYALARSCGHLIVPTTPALAPLILEGDFHPGLSGISHDAELVFRDGLGKPVRMRGSLLWTHFGISGPLVLDISRFWHRAVLAGRTPTLAINFLPGHEFETMEAALIKASGQAPRTTIRAWLADFLPARVGEAIAARTGIAVSTQLAHLSRESRRKMILALLEWTLTVIDSRGYGFAEVTAGGVPLDEIHSATMESRKCPGLFLVGEILDVDGRIGGFNFQWAWSSGFVAARGLAAAT